MGLNTNKRRQRLKRKRKWPPWLRSVTLLKLAFLFGRFLFRLWRIWNWFNGDPDG